MVSLFNAALALGAVLFVLTRGAEIGTVALAVIYFSTALPFIGTGIIVSLAISETIERVDKVYFFDLLGAAAGCLALVALLNAFGGPNTVIAVSIVFAAAAAIWFSLAGCRIGRIAGVGVGLLFTMLLIVDVGHPFIEVHFAKGQKLHDEQYTKVEQHLAHWSRADKDFPQNMDLHRRRRVNGDREFRFQPSDGGPEAGDLSIRGRVCSVQLVDLERAKTLIIGPGGGWTCPARRIG